MKKSTLPKPTDAELAILRVLWGHGRSTVRQVTDELNRAQRTGYTTALKFMQIMTEKGLVKREAAGRLHVYEATLTEGETQQQLIRHLLERAFGGSARNLVMQALAVKKAAPEELTAIRKLLDEIEGGSR
jgi:BlaI family penicillinase repressor